MVTIIKKKKKETTTVTSLPAPTKNVQFVSSGPTISAPAGTSVRFREERARRTGGSGQGGGSRQETMTVTPIPATTRNVELQTVQRETTLQQETAKQQLTKPPNVISQFIETPQGFSSAESFTGQTKNVFGREARFLTNEATAKDLTTERGVVRNPFLQSATRRAVGAFGLSRLTGSPLGTSIFGEFRRKDPTLETISGSVFKSADLGTPLKFVQDDIAKQETIKSQSQLNKIATGLSFDVEQGSIERDSALSSLALSKVKIEDELNVNIKKRTESAIKKRETAEKFVGKVKDVGKFDALSTTKSGAIVGGFIASPVSTGAALIGLGGLELFSAPARPTRGERTSVLLESGLDIAIGASGVSQIIPQAERLQIERRLEGLGKSKFKGDIIKDGKQFSELRGVGGTKDPSIFAVSRRGGGLKQTVQIQNVFQKPVGILGKQQSLSSGSGGSIISGKIDPFLSTGSDKVFAQKFLFNVGAKGTFIKTGKNQIVFAGTQTFLPQSEQTFLRPLDEAGKIRGINKFFLNPIRGSDTSSIKFALSSTKSTPLSGFTKTGFIVPTEQLSGSKLASLPAEKIPFERISLVKGSGGITKIKLSGFGGKQLNFNQAFGTKLLKVQPVEQTFSIIPSQQFKSSSQGSLFGKALGFQKTFFSDTRATTGLITPSFQSKPALSSSTATVSPFISTLQPSSIFTSSTERAGSLLLLPKISSRKTKVTNIESASLKSPQIFQFKTALQPEISFVGTSTTTTSRTKQGSGSSQAFKLITPQKTETITEVIPVANTTIPLTGTTPPRGFTGVPFFFKLPTGIPQFPQSRVRIKRTVGRTPSFAAAEFGFTSLKPVSFETTGLVERPLLVGPKKKKKKKRK